MDLPTPEEIEQAVRRGCAGLPEAVVLLNVAEAIREVGELAEISADGVDVHYRIDKKMYVVTHTGKRYEVIGRAMNRRAYLVREDEALEQLERGVGDG